MTIILSFCFSSLLLFLFCLIVLLGSRITRKAHCHDGTKGETSYCFHCRVQLSLDGGPVGITHIPCQSAEMYGSKTCNLLITRLLLSVKKVTIFENTEWVQFPFCKAIRHSVDLNNASSRRK